MEDIERVIIGLLLGAILGINIAISQIQIDISKKVDNIIVKLEREDLK